MKKVSAYVQNVELTARHIKMKLCVSIDIFANINNHIFVILENGKTQSYFLISCTVILF